MSKDEIFLKPTRLRASAYDTLSRLMLEVASQLVNRKDFPISRRASVCARGPASGR
jgi:hypothetical protein